MLSLGIAFSEPIPPYNQQPLCNTQGAESGTEGALNAGGSSESENIVGQDPAAVLEAGVVGGNGGMGTAAAAGDVNGTLRLQQLKIAHKELQAHDYLQASMWGFEQTSKAPWLLQVCGGGYGNGCGDVDLFVCGVCVVMVIYVCMYVCMYV